MVSIQKSLKDLDGIAERYKALLGCYREAVEAAGQYAVAVDRDQVRIHRDHLRLIGKRLGQHADRETVLATKPDFRGQMRDYRDKAETSLEKLRTDLAGTAQALEQLLESLANVGDDQQEPLEQQVGKLRTLIATITPPEAAAAVKACAERIEGCIEEMQAQQKATVGQFLVEIRVLHERIDGLQARAARDEASQLLTRREFEAQLEGLLAAGSGRTLILLHASNLFHIERMYSLDVASQVVAAFGKRLLNFPMEKCAAARWSDSEFLVLTDLPKDKAIANSRDLLEKLSGQYTCMEEGCVRHVQVRLNSGVLECTGLEAVAVLRRIHELTLGTAA